MNDDAAREKLAAAVRRRWARADATSIADALLPVVREIAAEELREAAEEYGVGMRPDFPGAALLRAVKTVDLHLRADALTKPPDGPVR